MTPCTEKDTLERIEATINKVYECLNGNGKVGLKTQVALHKNYFRIIAVLGTLVIGGKIAWGLIFP